MIAIIFVAFIIGLLYLFKIRSFDIYEKEPIGKLLIAFFLGGLFSIIISLFIYSFVGVKHNIFDAIFKIGLIEETSKLLSLIIIYKMIRKDFNEIVDGIIYITAISLGFAIIENILYVMESSSPYLLLFQRSVFAILGHISFSGYMGIAFFIHKRYHKNYIGIFLSIFISAFAHGLYDGFLFHQEIISFFNFIFIGLVVAQLYFFKVMLTFSRFRVNLMDDVFKPTGRENASFCSHCDSHQNSTEHKFRRILSNTCKKCGYFNVDSSNIKKFFKYFRPLHRIKPYLKKQKKKTRICYPQNNFNILFNTENKSMSANKQELQNWLEEVNINDKKRVLRVPIIGFLMKILGLQYIN